ncbi:hypothetical protein, partial [Klebsiella pneumoniae]|uniref:hypothetical protein n=1 Tax=Klebsiella pneumoniae TaxID=573 RepID=UPI0025A2E052
YLAKQIAKGAGSGVAMEGVTEGLQELVQIAGDRWAKDTNLFDDLPFCSAFCWAASALAQTSFCAASSIA